MIEILNGNLLTSDVDIICHQVNCQGVMGSGIALSIKKLYPNNFKKYKDLCTKYKSKELLGKTLITEENGKIIANLFGQEFYGKSGVFTSYEAISSSLEHLKEKLENSSLNKETFKIGFPYKMSSDRGGANWDRIYSIIENTFKDYNVKIYKLR